MDLEAHLRRQIAFSRATFGPGTRQKGVIDHIKKEIKELEATTDTVDRAQEWTDIVILALDGLWRELAFNQTDTVSWPDLAPVMLRYLEEKQNKNEQRDWPDWRTADTDKAIEHVRGSHD